MPPRIKEEGPHPDDVMNPSEFDLDPPINITVANSPRRRTSNSPGSQGRRSIGGRASPTTLRLKRIPTAPSMSPKASGRK
jgi:hypothetical protein